MSVLGSKRGRMRFPASRKFGSLHTNCVLLGLMFRGLRADTLSWDALVSPSAKPLPAGPSINRQKLLPSEVEMSGAFLQPNIKFAFGGNSCTDQQKGAKKDYFFGDGCTWIPIALHGNTQSAFYFEGGVTAALRESGEMISLGGGYLDGSSQAWCWKVGGNLGFSASRWGAWRVSGLAEASGDFWRTGLLLGGSLSSAGWTETTNSSTQSSSTPTLNFSPLLRWYGKLNLPNPVAMISGVAGIDCPFGKQVQLIGATAKTPVGAYGGLEIYLTRAIKLFIHYQYPTILGGSSSTSVKQGNIRGGLQICGQPTMPMSRQLRWSFGDASFRSPNALRDSPSSAFENGLFFNEKTTSNNGGNGSNDEDDRVSISNLTPKINEIVQVTLKSQDAKTIAATSGALLRLQGDTQGQWGSSLNLESQSTTLEMKYDENVRPANTARFTGLTVDFKDLSTISLIPLVFGNRDLDDPKRYRLMVQAIPDRSSSPDSKVTSKSAYMLVQLKRQDGSSVSPMVPFAVAFVPQNQPTNFQLPFDLFYDAPANEKKNGTYGLLSGAFWGSPASSEGVPVRMTLTESDAMTFPELDAVLGYQSDFSSIGACHFTPLQQSLELSMERAGGGELLPLADGKKILLPNDYAVAVKVKGEEDFSKYEYFNEVAGELSGELHWITDNKPYISGSSTIGPDTSSPLRIESFARVLIEVGDQGATWYYDQWFENVWLECADFEKPRFFTSQEAETRLAALKAEFPENGIRGLNADELTKQLVEPLGSITEQPIYGPEFETPSDPSTPQDVIAKHLFAWVLGTDDKIPENGIRGVSLIDGTTLNNAALTDDIDPAAKGLLIVGFSGSNTRTTRGRNVRFAEQAAKRALLATKGKTSRKR